MLFGIAAGTAAVMKPRHGAFPEEGDAEKTFSGRSIIPIPKRSIQGL